MNMNDHSIEILPLVAAGEIRFGASDAEVVRILGQPQIRTRLCPSVLRLMYRSVCVDVDELGVRGVDLMPETRAVLFGQSVFEVPDLFALLRERDKRSFIELGFVYFPGIGIGLPEDWYGPECARVITTFRDGAIGEPRRPPVP